MQLSVDYIADRTAAEERIRMYARFEVYSRISIDLVSDYTIGDYIHIVRISAVFSSLYIMSFISDKMQQ